MLLRRGRLRYSMEFVIGKLSYSLGLEDLQSTTFYIRFNTMSKAVYILPLGLKRRTQGFLAARRWKRESEGGSGRMQEH